MIKELQSKVKRLLESKEAYRDSDAALMARMWYDDYDRLGLGIRKDENFVSFLIALKDGLLTNWDSATRCRRKVQEQFPHLRGFKYKFRKENAAEAIKKELKQMDQMY